MQSGRKRIKMNPGWEEVITVFILRQDIYILRRIHTYDKNMITYIDSPLKSPKNATRTKKCKVSGFKINIHK